MPYRLNHQNWQHRNHWVRYNVLHAYLTLLETSMYISHIYIYILYISIFVSYTIAMRVCMISLQYIFQCTSTSFCLRLFFSWCFGHFSLRRLSSSLVVEPTHFKNMIVKLDHFLRARKYQNISKTTHLENVSNVSFGSIWANSIIAACNLYLSWTHAIFF